MRSEKEMYDLILGYAKNEDDIRAVILNGSRANPDRKPDPFNDFDIVYLVRNVEAYKQKAWNTEYGEKLFGEMLVYERTDENEIFDEHFPEFICYLMQFADGNRIDLSIADIKNYEGYCFGDGYAAVLLDKDNVLPEVPVYDGSGYFIQKPTEQIFFECRTEFWWVAPYAAKGLWRNQLLYAHAHVGSIRDMLIKMLGWYVGTEHGFDLSLGKKDDRLQELLPAELWEGLLSTYPHCNEEDIWRALFDACALFTKVSKLVADRFGFPIRDEYDRHVTAFLKYTKELPRDAETIDFSVN